MTRDQRNKIDQIEDEYFHWLCNIVTRRDSDTEMSDFCKTLHEKYFYGGVPNDDNRREDGLRLRNYFLSDNPFGTERLGGPCTIFELLIGVADRMDYTLSELKSGRQTAKWFWVLVSNLGLEQFTSNDQEIERKKSLNDLILTKFIERTYSYNGNGGLFPLKRPRRDQRKVEIWYQMQAYIEENF